MTIRTLTTLGAIALLCAAAPVFAQRGGRGGGPPLPQNLAFRFMGPAVGNRIAAAAGVVGDSNTYYAGAASGGVWKSTDKGAYLGADLRRHAGAGDRRAGRFDAPIPNRSGPAPAKPGPSAIAT